MFGQFMDIGIVVAVVMLVVWAVAALGFSAPGWIHLLLTFGVSLLIWRVAVRGDPAPRPDDRRSAAPRKAAASRGRVT